MITLITLKRKEGKQKQEPWHNYVHRGRGEEKSDGGIKQRSDPVSVQPAIRIGKVCLKVGSALLLEENCHTGCF